MKFQIL